MFESEMRFEKMIGLSRVFCLTDHKTVTWQNSPINENRQDN